MLTTIAWSSLERSLPASACLSAASSLARLASLKLTSPWIVTALPDGWSWAVLAAPCLEQAVAVTARAATAAPATKRLPQGPRRLMVVCMEWDLSRNCGGTAETCREPPCGGILNPGLTGHVIAHMPGRTGLR